MSHASGLAQSAQPVPRPAPGTGKPSVPKPNPSSPGPKQKTSSARLDPTPHHTSNPSASHILKRDTDRWSEHGPARRAYRKWRSSPPRPCRIGSPMPLAIRARNARHESVPSTVSSVTTNLPYHGLTRCEFEFCRQILRTVFQRCTDIEFARLCVIISCLLTCFQALHMDEVQALLMIHLGKGFGGETCGDNGDGTIIRILQAKYDQLLFLDSSDHLRFAHPLISRFLLAYPVRGIDCSHAVLAKACIMQVESDGGIPKICAVSTTIRQTDLTATHRFSVYAAANWQKHYRLAERLCPSATAIVHRMLWTEVVKHASCPVCTLSRTDPMAGAIREALRFCTDGGFRVLSDSYGQMLREMNGSPRPPITHEKCICVSAAMRGERSPSPVDDVLARLELDEEDSDSDGWSLV